MVKTKQSISSLSVLLLNCTKWLKKSAILKSQIDYCLALKETKKWKFLEIVSEQILLLPILNLFLPYQLPSSIWKSGSRNKTTTKLQYIISQTKNARHLKVKSAHSLLEVIFWSTHTLTVGMHKKCAFLWRDGKKAI